ncbi:MAG: ChaN family lipoprotein, partial [Desulfovibrionales bacterium]
AFLPEEIIPPPADQEETLREQFRMHSTMLDRGEGERVLENFILAQSLWDSFMAQKAAELSIRYQRPVIVAAGAGHVEFGWGIAHRIRALLPEAKIVSILPWRGGDNPQQEEGDFFFFCPERHRSRMGYELEQRFDGLRVRMVEEGSRAATAGLKPGDVIERANGQVVDSLLDLHRAGFAAGRKQEPFTLTVLRDGQTVQVTIERDSGAEE